MAQITQFPGTEKETVYKKIKISFKAAKDRFYRVILVRPNVGLPELAAIFCTVLGTEFEHYFSFSKGRVEYVLPDMLDEGYFGQMVPMSDYTLDDLEDTFNFLYDYGDGWEFSCKVYKKEVTKPGNKKVWLLEGKGQGVWEDNIGTIYGLLGGTLDPDMTEEDLEDTDVYAEMPWNFEIERLGDFDNPLDIDFLQEKLDATIDSSISQIVEFFGDVEEDDDNVESDDDFMENLMWLLSLSLEQQINGVSYVKETFERLQKKHGEQESYAKIMDVLQGELYGLLSQRIPYGMESYKDKLRKLK